MDLRSLRYFIAVVDAGSLSRAAASLYVAQPALTARIKKLEGDLGARLLERSHAGVAPTPVGLQLYHDALRLLADAAAIEERIQRSGASPEGSVTLALPLLLVPLLAGPLLVGVRAAYPRIRVFVLDDMSLMVRKAVVEGRADLGILVDTPRGQGLVCRPLAEEALLLSGHDPAGAVASELVDGEAVVRFAAAAALPLVLQSPRFSIRQDVERLAAERGLALNIVHEHDSTRVIRSLHLAGAGFTFMPASSVFDQPPNRPGWLRARVVDPEIVRRYDLAHPSARSPSPAAAAVAEFLLEQVRQMVASGAWQARLL
ncbi:MAG: LysR family transcriptional regulator [Burkholderiales bacterium]|nr:LysR family transcriptional regulator [Burkholderiales bacterium]